MAEPLLSVEGLTVRLPGPNGPVTVVDGVDFTVDAGEIFGVAGESGSGKTMTFLSLLRLLPAGATVHGEARFSGQNLLTAPAGELRRIRGRQIAMVFQDPMTSLHPMLSIGRQLTDHLRTHLGVNRRSARARAAELLDEVRIPDPSGALRAYPHQFSGGMRQRIAIAVALACRPRLIVADEPTTALDVTVQAGVLHLLDRLRRDHGVAVALITHDLGVMSALADRVSVFYAGRIVESGTRADVLRDPGHPYTDALIGALSHTGALRPLPGSAPGAAERPGGCAFHPRCRYATERCAADDQTLVPISPGHLLACAENPLTRPRKAVAP
ncbi:ABC transporter ATP-binding protein [Rhizohabitans arisaemae]|uniref:ABC transporter ATP-binding protein n=1 Tax=Rhizohabitans arisaemae TaxID=2720610 RepID=UPI0024B0566F|nr:ABC transporter ATP-binding protein [Rhizohabitans arisaemae]